MAVGLKARFSSILISLSLSLGFLKTEGCYRHLEPAAKWVRVVGVGKYIVHGLHGLTHLLRSHHGLAHAHGALLYGALLLGHSHHRLLLLHHHWLLHLGLHLVAHHRSLLLHALLRG
jgi:hypothetical protein